LIQKQHPKSSSFGFFKPGFAKKLGLGRELMLGGCTSSTFPTKLGLVDFLEPRVLPEQGAVFPSACGGIATPRSHLANEFHQIQFVNYYMSVTFFVILKSVKRC